jgi:transposase
MMATKERDFSPLEDLSLEDLVPQDNFYRRLERTVDLSFVRELVRERYASGGRPSVDPVVFFKLQLVLFFEDLRSERRLMEVAADRLSIRWYLGYDLNEPLPDHSSLTYIRQRYGLEVFRRFFEEIVELCIEAGLAWGKELYFDSTKVEANADVDGLRSRCITENHLRELFEETGGGPEKKVEDFAAPPPIPDAPATDALPTAGDEALKEDNAQKQGKDWISRDGRQDRAFSSGARERTADRLVSTTDPDATPMRASAGETKLGYQTHYVVDGGKARVILNALVAPSEVSENRPMLDLLWRSAFRWRLWPHHVTGDAKYGTAENVRAIESAHIRAYVALHESGGKGRAFFGKGEFVYDPKRDVYMCPRGEPLRLEAHDRSTRRKRYRAKAAACEACPLKSKCTTNKLGRIVMRNFDEEYLDRVRAYRETEPYRKALRKRQVWIEPLFAEAKDWHGMRRFRLRGLEKVNTEALLIASGQNVKRLLAFGGHRPKKLAQAAALRPPAATGNKISRPREHRVEQRSCSPTRAFFNTLPGFRERLAAACFSAYPHT